MLCPPLLQAAPICSREQADANYRLTMASSRSETAGNLHLKSFPHSANSAQQKHDAGAQSGDVKTNQGPPRPVTDRSASREVPGEATRSKLGGPAGASKGTIPKPKFSAGREAPDSPRTPGLKMSHFARSLSFTATPSSRGGSNETTGQTTRPKASDVTPALIKSKEDVKETFSHLQPPGAGKSADSSSCEGPKTARADEKDVNFANPVSVATTKGGESSDKPAAAHAAGIDGHPATSAAQLKPRRLPVAGTSSFTKPKFAASNPGTPTAKTKATGAAGHWKELSADHRLLGRSTPVFAAKTNKLSAAPRPGTPLQGMARATAVGNHARGRTPAKSSVEHRPGSSCKIGLMTKIATPGAKATCTPALKSSAGRTRSDVTTSTRPSVNGCTLGGVASSAGNKPPGKSALWRPKLPTGKEPVRSESTKPEEEHQHLPGTPIQPPETDDGFCGFDSMVPTSSLALLRDIEGNPSAPDMNRNEGTEDQLSAGGHIPNGDEKDADAGDRGSRP